MTSSGTTTFDLAVTEIVEEAYERCGVEPRNGYDMRTARRSLNLLMLEWANRGINLWTVEKRTQALTNGVADYTLGSDIVDLIEHMVELPNQPQTTRLNLTRVSVSTHASRTNPDIIGRPTEIYVDRQVAAPIVHLWPVPDIAGYTLEYWILRRMQDVGAYTNTMDTPFRFLPALVGGLAYHMARKILTANRDDTRWAVNFLEARIQRLQVDYEASFEEAAGEDRDRSTLSLVPLGGVYRL
jgi:hypothetical protein